MLKKGRKAMKNNENIVVIQTKEKDVKRKILAVIEKDIGLRILLQEEPFCMKACLDNDIVVNIIKMLIMEGLLNLVTIQPYSKAKGQKIVPTITKEDTAKNSKEASKQIARQPAKKDACKKQTVKDRILLFMQQEGRVLSNAEIIATVGDNINLQNLYHTLRILCEQGKIEKVGRGYWIAKAEGTIKQGEEEQEGQETKEKTVQTEISEEIRQQVLNFFQTTDWQMTKDEVVHKLNIEPEVVTPILDVLVQNKKLQKEGDNYKIYQSPFGIFEDEEYKVLLDYIMERDHFLVMAVESKFPQEVDKLPTLLNAIGSKYLKEQKDQEGCYNVYLKGRILYYVLTHNNFVKLEDIRYAFPSESSQNIANAINASIHNKQMRRKGKCVFEVLQM